MLIKRTAILTILILACSITSTAEQTTIWQGYESNIGPVGFGILFSTNDLLLDIEGFQGGVGAKIGFESWTLRGTADLLISTAFDPFSISLGAVLEKQLWPGPLSVYWGPLAETGFTTISLFKTDDDNWSRSSTLPLSLGCVFGVELFLFEFLSVFLEYQAALDLGLNITRISTSGTVTSTTEFTYSLDIGMGNNAMFGIVFYLMKRETDSEDTFTK